MESISYALGILFAKNLQDQGLEEISSDDMSKGLAEQMAGNATLTPEAANALVGEFFQAKKEAQGAAYRTECENFLTDNAKNKEVQVTDSGLQYTHMNEGTGDAPTAESTVTVHYRGTLLDGTEFDSSYSRGEPISFPLSGVIKGWTEGVTADETRWEDQVLYSTRIGLWSQPEPQRSNTSVRRSDLRSGIDLRSITRAFSSFEKPRVRSGLFVGYPSH